VEALTAPPGGRPGAREGGRAQTLGMRARHQHVPVPTLSRLQTARYGRRIPTPRPETRRRRPVVRARPVRRRKQALQTGREPPDLTG